jgi:hypothetical protein
MAPVSGNQGRDLQRDTVSRVDGYTYPAADVAKRLGFTSDALIVRARAGQIPGAFKVGGTWRFRAAQIEAWTRGWWDPDSGVAWDDYVAGLQLSVYG